jgi:hypothetical protein
MAFKDLFNTLANAKGRADALSKQLKDSRSYGVKQKTSTD